MGKKKNETALQVYVNEQFGKIRAMLIDGVPYFVGKDVAAALGYKKPENAVKNHVDDEDKTSTLIQGSGSNYKSKTVLINESGLYSLALKSQLDSAKPFRRWVTSEVLPSIRKTGAYVNPNFDNDRWVKTREGSKDAAKVMSAAIKIFIDYARAQGCDWEEKHYYSQAHLWCNAGAGLPKKEGRDTSTVQQLNNIDLLNRNIVTNVLFNGMADGLHYTQIWARIPQRINAFLEITFQTPKLIGE